MNYLNLTTQFFFFFLVPFHTVECHFETNPEYKGCVENFLINESSIIVQKDDLDRDHGTTNYSCKVTCWDNPTSKF